MTTRKLILVAMVTGVSVLGFGWMARTPGYSGLYEGSMRDARRQAGLAHNAGRPSILLVTIDTLRADHMGIYGYSRATTPQIDRWFSDARIFDAAYSTEANTTPSVVSILTGMLPQQHRVRLFFQRISPEVLTVADLLGEAGYETAAIVSNMVLTAEAVGLNERFDFYDDFVDERERYRPDTYERRAGHTTDAALAWLDGRREKERPFLLWVHYMDPHGPYSPPAGAPADFTHSSPLPIDASRIPDYQRHPEIQDAREYVDLYDEEIAYTDREVGRLLGEFKARTGANRLTVLAADHGETLMEHQQWFSHGYHVHDEIVHVPLLVQGASFEAGRVAHPVSLADVGPTLLEYAGIEGISGIYGQPLSLTRPGRPIFSEATDRRRQWRSLLLDGEKLVVELRAEGGIGSELIASLFGWNGLLGWNGMSGLRMIGPRLYAVGGDDRTGSLTSSEPSERARRLLLEAIEDDPDTAGVPSALRMRMTRGYGPSAPKVAPGVNPASLRRLRSLGYVR